MTRRQRASEQGLEPHYKVRVVIPGALLHLASRDKPRWERDAHNLPTLVADWIVEPEYGDTPISIEWTAVVAVTCRWSE